MTYQSPAPRRRSRVASWRMLMHATLSLAWVALWAAVAGPADASVVTGGATAWAAVPLPPGISWAVHDVSCFGSTGIVLAGDGHVAYSRDAGGTWTVVVPPGHAGTSFVTAAFDGSGHGVAASGGLLLVTRDWGATWAPPAYADSGPTGGVTDVVMRGGRAVAVGGGGMILASADSGATWQTELSPVLGDLTSVALASDGTAVAGSQAGEIVVRTTAWAVAMDLEEAVTSVAAAPSVAWGDGRPDLFATTGRQVLGSDDGLTFAPLPGLPDLTADPRAEIAWAGQPARSLLVAGDLAAGFLGSTGEWVSAATALDGLVSAAAPGGQSVAYLLDAGGRLERTVSAGREPASIVLSRSRVTTGATASLSGTVHVSAPGTVVLLTRVPGRPWTTLRRLDWGSSDWDRRLRVGLSPSLNHDYVLEFRYGRTATRITSVAALTVVPKVTTTRSRYELRRGEVFRFSGSVSPRLRGERVELFTDRGGSWRPVSLQRSVTLIDGRTWQSRRFGTPKAETYRLRAHVARTATHGEAWSRTVTVTIR